MVTRRVNSLASEMGQRAKLAFGGRDVATVGVDERFGSRSFPEHLSARRSATVARPILWTSFFETVGRSVRRWGHEMPGGETVGVLVRLSEGLGTELVMKMS